jgi:hypothetical protein
MWVDIKIGHCYLMIDDLKKAYSSYQQALYFMPNPQVSSTNLGRRTMTLVRSASNLKKKLAVSLDSRGSDSDSAAFKSGTEAMVWYWNPLRPLR